MPFCNPARDRQSQARPFRLQGSGAKEPIEYARLGALGKERSRVGHFDDEAAVVSPDDTSLVRPTACIAPHCR